MLAPQRSVLFCIAFLSLQLIMGYIMTIFSYFSVPLEVCFYWLKFLFFPDNLGLHIIFLRGARHQWSIQKIFESRQAILVNRHGPPYRKSKLHSYPSTHIFHKLIIELEHKKYVPPGFEPLTLSMTRTP